MRLTEKYLLFEQIVRIFKEVLVGVARIAADMPPQRGKRGVCAVRYMEEAFTNKEERKDHHEKNDEDCVEKNFGSGMPE